MSTPADSPDSHAPEDADASSDTETAQDAPPEPQPQPDARSEPQPQAEPALQAQMPPQPLPQPIPAQYAQYRPGRPPYTGPYQPPRIDLRNPRWKNSGPGASQLIVWLITAVSLFGGWAVFHSDGVGIGLAITGIAMIAVPLLAGGREAMAIRLPGAALIAALWLVAAVRDAGWVVTLCAIAALLLTPLVLAPQQRFTGTLTAVFGYLEGLGEAFSWMKRGRNVKGTSAARHIRVIAITVGLLVVFGGLFAAADQSFANLLAALIPYTNPFVLILRLMLAGLLFGLILLWAVTARVRPVFDPAEPAEPRSVSRFEIALPLGALNVLFAAFIGTQARAYFGGEEYVMETAGLTFADYARQGFWQLSVVSVLSLCVIAVAAWLAPRRRRSDRWLVRVLLASLCGLSLVVVASALLRMREYFETFGLTRLRMWVFTVEIWLAILFVLVLVCCWKLRASWLPKGILASGVMVMLGLAAVNPDAFIADYNIDRYEATGKLDLDYLGELSADAVPAVERLPEDVAGCVMVWGRSDWDDRAPLAWNLGWARAADQRRDDAENSSLTTFDCPNHIGPGYDSERSIDEAAPEHSEEALEPASETTEPADDYAEPADGQFFSYSTCEALDMAATERMFGTSAKGDYGVLPDDGNHGGSVYDPEWVDAGEPYGRLECAFYGPGTRYISIMALGYPSEEDARDSFETTREGTADWSPYESALVDDGYTSPEFRYMVIVDHLTFSVTILDAGDTPEMTDVAIDLAENQLYGHYQELG